MGRRKAEGGEKSGGGGKGGPGLGNLDVETAELYSGQIPSFVPWVGELICPLGCLLNLFIDLHNIE